MQCWLFFQTWCFWLWSNCFGLPQNGLAEIFRFLHGCPILLICKTTGFYLTTLPLKPCWLSFLLIVEACMCSKRGLRIPNLWDCCVLVGFFLQFLGILLKVVHRHSCSLLQCSPFVEDLPHSGQMELKNDEWMMNSPDKCAVNALFLRSSESYFPLSMMGSFL